MIFDEAAQRIVGNLGWVDKGSLWVYDLKLQKETLIPVSGASYLDLRMGTRGLPAENPVLFTAFFAGNLALRGAMVL
jgi:hypothetical protein